METPMSRRPAAHIDDERATMPAELLTEFCDARFGADDVLGIEPLDELGVGLPHADLWALARFKERMAAEGWVVHTARMIFDRVYAHERIALGHTSASAELRRLALELFRGLHSRDGIEH
jgi:hypothetical protein